MLVACLSTDLAHSDSTDKLRCSRHAFRFIRADTEEESTDVAISLQYGSKQARIRENINLLTHETRSLPTARPASESGGDPLDPDSGSKSGRLSGCEVTWTRWLCSYAGRTPKPADAEGPARPGGFLTAKWWILRCPKKLTS